MRRWLVLTVLVGVGCVEDPELGQELQSFCALLREAEARFPEDRAQRSSYVATRSDAALQSKSLVEVMRKLAIAEREARPAILVEAGERGGLDDFRCPEMLRLYRSGRSSIE